MNIFCLKNAWTEPKAVDVRFGFTKIDENWKPTPEEPEIPDQFPLIWIRCQVGRKPKMLGTDTCFLGSGIICKKESESTPGGSLHGGPQEWMVYNGKSMKIPKNE